LPSFPAEAGGEEDHLVEGTTLPGEVLQAGLVEEALGRPGEDHGAGAGGAPGGPESARRLGEGQGGSLDPRPGAGDETVGKAERPPHEDRRIEQADAERRHLGRILRPDVHIGVGDPEGGVRQRSPLDQVDRRQGHPARDEAARAADRERLSLVGLLPEGAHRGVAGGRQAQIAVLLDAADDEARLVERTGDEPARRPRADGDREVPQGIGFDGEAGEPGADEGRGIPLMAGHRWDAEEGEELLPAIRRLPWRGGGEEQGGGERQHRQQGSARQFHLNLQGSGSERLRVEYPAWPPPPSLPALPPSPAPSAPPVGARSPAAAGSRRRRCGC